MGGSPHRLPVVHLESEKAVGWKVYTIVDRNEKYCSACCDDLGTTWNKWLSGRIIPSLQYA